VLNADTAGFFRTGINKMFFCTICTVSAMPVRADSSSSQPDAEACHRTAKQPRRQPVAAVGLAKHPHLALQCKNKAFRSSSLTSASVLPVLWEGVPVSSVICAIPPCQRQARRSSKGGTSPWQHSTSYLRGLAQRYAGRPAVACILHPASSIHLFILLPCAWHGTALPPMPACSHGKLCRRTDERLD